MAAEPDRHVLRASVAALCRVVFERPSDGAPMLALERRATRVDQPHGPGVRVSSVPFGGAVRLRDVTALAGLIGEVRYDSTRSRAEHDFRILIPPEAWPAVRQFSVEHLGARADSAVLDAAPDRELAEEFADALGLRLAPAQYTAYALGTVIEDEPSPSASTRAPGLPTVRVYRIYTVRLVEAGLMKAVLASSNQFSDEDLAAIAEGGRGRANAALALPLADVRTRLEATPPAARHEPCTIHGHMLDGSVSALFEDLAGPRRRWI